MASRYLGVDLGTKRIGLALGEVETGVVSPLKVIEARSDRAENAQAILAVAEEYGADVIVIGLPLNMDGTEGPQAKLSKSLAEAMRTARAAAGGGRESGTFEIHLHDERLTSYAADQRMSGRQLTHKRKKARQDAVAAQVLLQSFFECRRDT